MSTIRKDGTRGPSWSWTSVDGAVEIGDWSGYLYGGIPGDIKWLARVVKAETKLASNDIFGQVSSGTLTLTGLLGVFRINKEGIEPPYADNDTIVHTGGWFEMSWDTKELEQQFSESGQGHIKLWRYCEYGLAKGTEHGADPLDVFYVPVRLMDEDPDGKYYERPMLKGLLLLPTRKKNGHFQRVGQFEISEYWTRNLVALFTNKMRALSPRFYMSKDKNGDYTIIVV